MNANGGFASCEDPVTHMHYHIVQYDPPAIGDDHVRQKLTEAQADMDQGRFADWNVSEIKRELYNPSGSGSRRQLVDAAHISEEN
jgi:hypothetical protein